MLFGRMIRHLLKGSYTVFFVKFLFVGLCCKCSNHYVLDSKSINIVGNALIPHKIPINEIVRTFTC